MPSEMKKHMVWVCKCFDDFEELPFEFLTVPVPAGYLELLQALYGGWEKPVRGKSVHVDSIFDLERNYNEFFRGRKQQSARY